jgi:hypothetical protein
MKNMFTLNETSSVYAKVSTLRTSPGLRVIQASCITSHQSWARKFLDLSDIEEEDDTAPYQDTHIFVEGEDGDLILIRNPGDVTSGDILKPESFNIAMLLILRLPACQARRLDALVQAEIQLHIGQCNDALQAIHFFIGKKAFVFKMDV